MAIIITVKPTLIAPALRLRPWCHEDAGALMAAHQDPALRQWLQTSIETSAEARRWIEAQAEAWAAGTRFSFAVLSEPATLTDQVGPIGHVVVKGIDPSAASAAVGYWTAPEARGRGVAPRAVDAVSRWALGKQLLTTRLTRLCLLHAVDNRASCRVAEKCRFTLATVLPPLPPEFVTDGHLHVRTDA